MKVQELPEWVKAVEEHPLVQKIRAERAAEVLEIRHVAADRIARIREESEDTLPGLQAAEGQARAALAEHDARREALQKSLTEAVVAVHLERQRIDAEVRLAESALLETAPPEIDETIFFFREMHEALLRKKPQFDTAPGRANVFSMSKEVFVRSNATAIARGLRYCLDAIAELERMKLVPALDADRIDAMKKGVPNVDEVLETVTDKPLPRVNTDWRSQFPSDDELSWRMGRLLDKSKKILRGG
jgi:hypothetical protein